MCEYCKVDESDGEKKLPLCRQNFGNIHLLTDIDIENTLIVTSLGYGGKLLEQMFDVIHYCPMCGRKLGE